MLSETTQTSLTNVCTPASMVEENPDLFTEPQLDWILKTRHKNGLHETGAVLKISRKLYLNKSIFIDWFMSQKAA